MPSTASSGTLSSSLDRAGVVAGLERELGLEPLDLGRIGRALLEIGEQRARVVEPRRRQEPRGLDDVAGDRAIAARVGRRTRARARRAATSLRAMPGAAPHLISSS